MKKVIFLFALAICLIGSSLGLAQAPKFQNPPRKDDHFQRQKVVIRIPLDEKINSPMIRAQQTDIYGNNNPGYNQGIVAALISGLQSGLYPAYSPENLDESLSYNDLIRISSEMEPGTEEDEEEDTLDWGDTDLPNVVEPPFEFQTAVEPDQIDIAPLESVIEIIEDRIFDKNRSSEIFDVQYIRLVWVDPAESMPDKLFAVFKYEDVLEILENTKCISAKNDAENRNLKEIIDLRMFNSYAINISGNGVKSMDEAQYRINQLTAFEHNLWNY